ncbi:HpcH/HpaI aldolase family protein [Paraburkholderia sp. GAS82]|uniref:HpcH/HpaI aldolase family protein n=1 Tax=Paraburkholderia sp. GAS82 TaxID=3035137 RepID=UPI003D1EBF76
MTADRPNGGDSASSVRRETNLRVRLRKREPFLALFSIIPAVELVEIAAQSGFDGIILDTEHGSFGTETLPALILAARAYGIFPIVRVRCNDASLIGAALDAGAAGVLVPQIGSMQEATQAVRAARFAPQGSRGANPWVRAGGYGCSPRWFETANDETAVLLMIEGAGGLAALDSIMGIADLDGIFLGPVDLSHALGVPGQINHETVRAAITTTINHALEASVAPGVFSPTATVAKTWLDCGARFVAIGVDTAHIGFALSNLVQDVRSTAQATGRIQN